MQFVALRCVRRPRDGTGASEVVRKREIAAVWSSVVAPRSIPCRFFPLPGFKRLSKNFSGHLYSRRFSLSTEHILELPPIHLNDGTFASAPLLNARNLQAKSSKWLILLWPPTATLFLRPQRPVRYVVAIRNRYPFTGQSGQIC